MSEPGGSVYVPEEEVAYDNVERIFDSRLSYWKGAIIIHMIRFELQDDSLFFQVLRNFQNEFANNTASATDFLNVLNETSVMDFTEFFNQWYYGEGYPVYSFNWVHEADIFTLTSTQSVSMPDVTPFFDMHFPVKIYYNNSEDTTAIFHQTEIQNVFSVPISGTIDSIKIDPDLWVLKKIENFNNINSGLYHIDVNIHPNPFKNKIYIENNEGSSVEITISDLQGRIIFQHKLRQPFSTLDMSMLNPGIYLVSIKTAEKYTARKMFKN